ncbi:hypothetical protein Salat_0642900 [Sesamum alatum]|uniref:Uncharacterized protein n=1 Tax=Sesamum alatum TaxID=300844 RepID=A0AAE1YR27_9LAMI|nr:hypothetical protein Salat_0642900 [Sesamum alatum]
MWGAFSWDYPREEVDSLQKVSSNRKKDGFSCVLTPTIKKIVQKLRTIPSLSPIGSLSLLHGIRRPLTAPYSPHPCLIKERKVSYPGACDSVEKVLATGDRTFVKAPLGLFQQRKHGLLD